MPNHIIDATIIRKSCSGDVQPVLQTNSKYNHINEAGFLVHDIMDHRASRHIGTLVDELVAIGRLMIGNLHKILREVRPMSPEQAIKQLITNINHDNGSDAAFIISGVLFKYSEHNQIKLSDGFMKRIYVPHDYEYDISMTEEDCEFVNAVSSRLVQLYDYCIDDALLISRWIKVGVYDVIESSGGDLSMRTNCSIKVRDLIEQFMEIDTNSITMYINLKEGKVTHNVVD